MADAALVSADQLSGFTKLTVEEIRDCVKAGRIPKPAGGRYNLNESIKGAFLFRFDQVTKPLTWDKDKLRTITGLSDQRHRQLANEGHFPAPIRGHYQVEATCAGIIRYFKELHQRRDKTLGQKRERKLDNENELLEIEIAERSAQLIPVDEMVARLTPAIGSMRQRILASTLTEDERDELIDDLGRILDEAIKRPVHRSGQEDSSDSDAAAQAHREQMGGPAPVSVAGE
jgi:hypothetical protein